MSPSNPAPAQPPAAFRPREPRPPPLAGLIGGAALACIALGALVLAGWTLDIVALKSVWPGFVSMKANTALAFVLCGAALWELRLSSSDTRDGTRRPAQIAAVTVFALAALTLGEHLFSWNAGIDQLLFHERAVASGALAPGRMAAFTALSFAAIGAALFLLLRSSPERHARGVRPLAEGIGGIVIFLGLTALGGHARVASMMFGWGHFTEGSILASAGFVVLGTGLFAVAWRERRLPWAIGTWPTAGFLSGLVALVVLIGAAQTSIEHMRQGAQHVAQSNEARFRASALLHAVGDMGTASLSYAASGDDSRAATYHAAVQDLAEAMDSLRRAATSDSDERQLLSAVEPIIAARVDDVRETVERRRARREAAALAVARSRRVQSDMDGLRRAINRLDREAERLAQARQAASDLTTRGMFLTVQLGGVVSLLLLALMMLRTNNEFVARTHAERAQRESEERLRLATEEGGVAVWEYDFNSDTMERSDNHDALYGLERQETWRLDTFLNATHPDDRGKSNNVIQSSVSPGGSDNYQFDFRVVHPDESVHWLSVVGRVAERDSRGQGTVVRGFLIDITDRKLAEEQLRRTATDLRLQGAALSAAANAIMITDREGTIEWVNPAFTVITGYGAGEAIGKNPRDIVKSGVHDRPFYDAMWSTLLAEGVWRGEITNRRKDGTLYPELMSMTPVRDANGDITNFIAIKEDLTERRRLEATLAQSQRLETVGSLAGGVAHDFNNLLTVISGAAELAALEAPRDSQLFEATATIRSAADRAAALTRQLLAFSRKQFLQPVVAELNTVVKNFQPMVRRLVREDIEMRVELSRDAGNVRVDVAQIDQVLLNLVVNSRDAMPNGGTLTIETGGVVLDASDARIHPGMTPGPHAMLAVTDTGIGMDEATRQRMFDPFFTTKEHGKGTGLGMATVYGIVKQSGGSIWAYSEVGRGTTIKVYFPQVADAAAAVKRAKGLRTEVKILVTSGYLPDGAELSDAIAAGVHCISKPYSLAELTNKIREVLDAPPTV